MADEPVVVLKCRPVNAGNGREDKTDTITDWFSEGHNRQKRGELRRGEAFLKNDDDRDARSAGVQAVRRGGASPAGPL